MNISAQTCVLEQLAALHHLAPLRWPLYSAVRVLPPDPTRPAAVLPAAALAPPTAFYLPPDVAAHWSFKLLPAVCRPLVARYAHQLLARDIRIRRVEAVPYGLRLHLTRRCREACVRVYHDTRPHAQPGAARTTVVREGKRTWLTKIAAACLTAPLPATAAEVDGHFPAGTPLPLLATYYHLQARTDAGGWHRAWLKMRPAALHLWLDDGAGLVQLVLRCPPGATTVEATVHHCPTEASRTQLLAWLGELVNPLAAL